MGVPNYNTDSPELERVNEAIRLYVKDIDTNTPTAIKIGHMTYTEFFENKMLIIHAIRQGLPYEVFSKIKEIMPFSEDDWAEYLNISKKTLHRHKNEPNFFFKPIHTEKIIELAEVTNYGKGVFDSNEQFYSWLHTPSYALGNLKPSELIKDSYGKELVMGELNRIEHGIFA